MVRNEHACTDIGVTFEIRRSGNGMLCYCIWDPLLMDTQCQNSIFLLQVKSSTSIYTTRFCVWALFMVTPHQLLNKYNWMNYVIHNKKNINNSVVPIIIYDSKDIISITRMKKKLYLHIRVTVTVTKYQVKVQDLLHALLWPYLWCCISAYQHL